MELEDKYKKLLEAAQNLIIAWDSDIMIGPAVNNIRQVLDVLNEEW